MDESPALGLDSLRTIINDCAMSKQPISLNGETLNDATHQKPKYKDVSMKFTIALLIGLMACGDNEPEAVASTPAKAEIAVEKVMKAPSKVPVPVPALAEAAPAGDDSSCGKELKNYGVFVDEYIKYMEKVSAGDMSAMTQVQGLMEKSQKSSQEIMKLQTDGKLDIPCFKKYQEINNRMSNAAMKMSGASEEDKKELEDIQKATDDALDSVGCLEACQTETDPMKMVVCTQGCM